MKRPFKAKRLIAPPVESFKKIKIRNDTADVLTSDTSIILQGNTKNESDLVRCMAHTHNCYHLLVLIVIHLKVTTHKEQMCSIATRKVVFVRN